MSTAWALGDLFFLPLAATVARSCCRLPCSPTVCTPCSSNRTTCFHRTCTAGSSTLYTRTASSHPHSWSTRHSRGSFPSCCWRRNSLLTLQGLRRSSSPVLRGELCFNVPLEAVFEGFLQGLEGVKGYVVEVRTRCKCPNKLGSSLSHSRFGIALRL